jgi:uncharacterized glyoxalase superfamily protein PhnB
MSPENRPNIFPALRYRDANAALEWCKRALGAEEKSVHRGDDGVIRHAELRLGVGLVMLGSTTSLAGSAAMSRDRGPGP